MIKRIAIIIIFMASQYVYSQIDSLKKFYIYTSPIQLLDGSSRQMVTLGGEIVLFKRIGLASEYGYKIAEVDDFDTTLIDSKGYSYRFELKYYCPNLIKNKILGAYFSLEYRYIKDNYNSMFDYFQSDTSRQILVDNYAILKDIYIANLKYGMVIHFSKLVHIDVYSGLGIRYRNVENKYREFNEELGHIHSSDQYFWTASDFQECSGYKLNFSLGFKVGIKF